ncbi:MAG TPA: MmcQ/YjbR family DNA-binding protein [Pseudonocardiaceae bacterium]|jgi:hypothetical protein|nr:MmcQ/YjbR family DNA-binding protein [Pseudonocardiaceae bacterium]
MSDLARARAVALALPEAGEQDHHGMASFRVRGKIFATVPDEEHLRVMVDENEIRATVAENPGTCAEFYWGKRLACVVVTLASASTPLLSELLTEAWLRKAPAALAREFESGRGAPAS